MLPTSELKFNEDYHLRNPERKTKAWGTRMVTALRMEWARIVNAETTAKNKAQINATQDLYDVQKGFKNAENKDGFKENTDWTAIAIYHRIVKILMAEFIKAAYSPHVEAVDVAAGDTKKRDKNMLANRSTLEGIMNTINQQVGDPQYKMPYDAFGGNVEEFDKLGLNSDDSEDIGFFFDNFYRLWQEISCEELTVSLMRYNEFETYVRKLVIDLMACNTMVFQVFASPYCGEIKWYYHQPEYIKAIKGERDDYKDAMCVGFEKNITVRQWIEFVGKEFDFSSAKDREALRLAVNYYNSTAYIEIDAKGDCWELDIKGLRYVTANYASLLTKHSVGCGYIEWLSRDGLAYKKNKESGIRDEIPYEYEVKAAKYEKETEEYEKVYKAWYLSTGLSEQELYRYGRLYHQTTDGNDDEYVNYSIQIVQSPDKSVAEITRHYNYIVQLAFFKMLWGIWESHPNVDYYDYDAIIDVISRKRPDNASATGDSMYPEGQQVVAGSAIEGQIDELLKNYTTSLKRIFVRPDNPRGGAERPHFKEEGGIDPIAVAMTTVLDWAEQKVMQQIGIDARSPETPNPKLGYRVQERAIQTSENATFDVPFMINNTIKNISTSSLKIAQDAIGAKPRTNVYDWLVKLIGKDSVVSIERLDGIPLHRYSIYVDVFNDQRELDKAKQIALQAFQTKAINESQYALIENLDNPKQVLMLLSYYARKNQKKQEEQAALQHRRQMELIQEQNKGKMAEKEAELAAAQRREETRGYYYVAGHEKDANAAIAKKQMDMDNNAQKMNEKADADIRTQREAANIEAQAPLPASAAELQDQSQVAESA